MEQPRHRLAEDLDGVLQRAQGDLEELHGARLFVTGGTGFIGVWLLEALKWADERLGLDLAVTVLSRDPAAFAEKAPALAGYRAFRFVQGDVVSFDPPNGRFTHVIHAGTETSTRVNDEDPLRALDSAVLGTRRVLEIARTSGTSRFLFTSSGAVYGPQPPSVDAIAEEYSGGPDHLSPSSAYAEGKRIAELMCSLYHAQFGLGATIARCFSFIGPGLQLDSHYAIGNFIADGLAGRDIVINGDGAPVRSYLYAADLVVWLLAVLVRGEPARAYNVGSGTGYSIAEVARLVADALEPAPVVGIRGKAGLTGVSKRYVPSVARCREELGLAETVGLSDAVRRTVEWARDGRNY